MSNADASGPQYEPSTRFVPADWGTSPRDLASHTERERELPLLKIEPNIVSPKMHSPLLKSEGQMTASRDMIALLQGDKDLLSKFCQVYKTMGTVGEQRAWGSSNTSGCDSCAQRSLQCSAGENIRCGECSLARRGCSRMAQYRRDRTTKELGIDDATFTRLLRYFDSLPVAAPSKGDSKKTAGPFQKRKAKVKCKPTVNNPVAGPVQLVPARQSRTPSPSDHLISHRRNHLSSSPLPHIATLGSPRSSAPNRCRVNTETPTPFYPASDSDNHYTHVIGALEERLEMVQRSSQETIRERDVLIRELQEQIDEMLRIEHNNLQVANLRLLQLRQHAKPNTSHERIIAAWHEDVVSELTKAYFSEKIRTRSLFDVGWKCDREDDGEEDEEEDELNEPASKRTRTDDDVKGKGLAY